MTEPDVTLLQPAPLAILELWGDPRPAAARLAKALGHGLPLDAAMQPWAHGPAKVVMNELEARFHLRAREHLRSSLAWKGPWEGVVEMRRHYGNYLKGLPNVKELRLRLCTERDPKVLEEIMDEADKQGIAVIDECPGVGIHK